MKSNLRRMYFNNIVTKGREGLYIFGGLNIILVHSYCIFVLGSKGMFGIHCV